MGVAYKLIKLTNFVICIWFREDHEVELMPLQEVERSYRRPEEAQTTPPQQTIGKA